MRIIFLSAPLLFLNPRGEPFDDRPLEPLSAISLRLGARSGLSTWFPGLSDTSFEPDSMGEDSGSNSTLPIFTGALSVAGLLVGLLFYYANETMLADVGFAFFIIFLIITIVILAWPSGGQGGGA